MLLRLVAALLCVGVVETAHAATFNINVDFNDASRLSTPNQNFWGYSGCELLSETRDGDTTTRTVRFVRGSDLSVQFTYALDPILISAGDQVTLKLSNFGVFSFGHNEFGTSGFQDLTLRGFSDTPTWDAQIDAVSQLSYDGGVTVVEHMINETIPGVNRSGSNFGPDVGCCG
ncbi:MAG: hypothetical protein ABJQ70_18210 [Roseobacter sp.]